MPVHEFVWDLNSIYFPLENICTNPILLQGDFCSHMGTDAHRVTYITAGASTRVLVARPCGTAEILEFMRFPRSPQCRKAYNVGANTSNGVL